MEFEPTDFLNRKWYSIENRSRLLVIGSWLGMCRLVTVNELILSKAGLAIEIAHVLYIKILTWIRGFRVKFANFSRLHYLPVPKRDLSTKKTKSTIEKWQESLGDMLDFDISNLCLIVEVSDLVPSVFHSPRWRFVLQTKISGKYNSPF